MRLPRQAAAGGAAAGGGRGGGGGGGGEPASGCTMVPGTGGGFGGGGGGGRGAAAPVKPNPDGNGVFRSEDGGKTWKQMDGCDDRPMYFSQIRVDPKDDQKIFTGGNPARVSHDGGKTWTGLTGSHTDYHGIYINPNDPRIVWVGHDGGLDSSNDGGVTFLYHNDIAVGQFYQVSADMRRPYYVCGGLQDNNAWCGPSALRSNYRAGEQGLVHHRGRRRLLYAPGPHRLGHRLRRIAGWLHEPSRSARRYAEEHSAESGRRARRGGGNAAVG